MQIHLYNEKGEAVKEFNLSSGKIYNFGINQKEKTFGILTSDDEGRILFKLAVDDDTRGEILDAGCDDALLVNNKPVNRSAVKLNDEILADNHLLRIGKPVKLQNYFFIEAKNHEEPIVVSEQAEENIVISSILPMQDQPVSVSDQLEADSYSQEKMHQQLGSLLDVTRELNNTFNLERLVDKIIDYVFQVMLIDRVAVIIYKPKEGKKQHLISRAACRRGLKCTNVAISKTILNAVLRDKVAVATSNAMEDPRFRSQDSVMEQQIRSAICLPFLHQNLLLGAIYADSLNPAVKFSTQDLQFLSILGNLTSIAIKNALRFSEMELELQGWKSGVPIDKLIIGNSSKSRELYALIRRVATSNVTVLLMGETGTGKELCARAIHQLSARRSKPFIAVNCATIPENLLESEMFGYEKGAFTGATARKLGKFELAEGGTIFLDEISEIPFELQSKLLRVLQEGEFERLGSPKTIKVDVRIIAAT
ncbi:sigma 54-interacting transcriptional regulator, partial [Candidatus Sumerlaeota bacterium]|nr:sigma 54-interacting transcriptional regulator [Candidatus Sumerlaeota bacterium]